MRRSLRRRLAVRTARVAVLIGIAVLAILAGDIVGGVGRMEGPAVPRPRTCVGLPCWGDSDCGTKCRCTLPQRGSLGGCVSKAGGVVRQRGGRGRLSRSRTVPAPA